MEHGHHRPGIYIITNSPNFSAEYGETEMTADGSQSMCGIWSMEYYKYQQINISLGDGAAGWPSSYGVGLPIYPHKITD